MDFATHGPLGILWVGLGLSAFYLALIWINTLLGVFLTPLFIVPATWLQDRVLAARRRRAQGGDGNATTSTVTASDARDPRRPEPRPR